MNKQLPNNTEITLKIDTRDLSPIQVRLLKRAHTLLLHVISSEEESEYFEASAQLLKEVIQCIKHANFPTDHAGKIPYGEQSIEYALESLSEVLTGQGATNLDN